MATSLMQKQKTGSWSAIFPTEQVTQQQSALFVKKLLAVAISNITYLRTIFPEHAFGDRCLEDLSLKILRDDSACPGACQVIQWVKGCFDALDRKYLRVIVVGIYADADNPMSAVETYTFKFDYSSQKGITIFRNDTEVASAFTETETKRATIKLLRTIIVLTQTLQPLPDDVMMTMKLYYYDDVTPEDYEPPGFESTTSEEFGFDETPLTIRVGDVNTPFHIVKLRIRTRSSQFTSVEEGQLKEGDMAEKQEERIFKDQKVDVMTDEEMEVATTLRGQANGNAHEPTELEQSCVVMDQNSSLLHAPSNISTTMHSSEDNTVHCPCGVNEDDGLMVLCAVCQVWQHAVCFRLIEENSVPDLHICVNCSKVKGRICTDPSLTSLTPAQIQSTCLWRRTVHACCDLTRVVPAGLARRLGVDVGVAQDIMGRLEREGYLRPPTKGRKWGRLVMKEKLQNEGMQKYLTYKTSENKPLLHQRNHTSTSKPLLSANRMETLTHKTADLDISVDPEMEPTKEQQKSLIKPHLMEKENQVRRSPRIQAKRVRSVNDTTKEFEVSCSQDQEQFDDVSSGRSRKRRKASIASHSIMV